MNAWEFLSVAWATSGFALWLVLQVKHVPIIGHDEHDDRSWRIAVGIAWPPLLAAWAMMTLTVAFCFAVNAGLRCCRSPQRVRFPVPPTPNER